MSTLVITEHSQLLASTIPVPSVTATAGNNNNMVVQMWPTNEEWGCMRGFMLLYPIHPTAPVYEPRDYLMLMGYWFNATHTSVQASASASARSHTSAGFKEKIWGIHVVAFFTLLIFLEMFVYSYTTQHPRNTTKDIFHWGHLSSYRKLDMLIAEFQW